MTEQEFDLVLIASNLGMCKEILESIKDFSHFPIVLSIKERNLVINTWNNLDRVITSLKKQIKIEQAEEVKK